MVLIKVCIYTCKLTWR